MQFHTLVLPQLTCPSVHTLYEEEGTAVFYSSYLPVGIFKIANLPGRERPVTIFSAPDFVWWGL